MLVVGGRGVKDAASLDSAGFEASVQLHDDDVVSLSLGESSQARLREMPPLHVPFWGDHERSPKCVGKGVPGVPGKAATCGDGVDAEDNPCQVNEAKTGCVSNTGTCEFVAGVEEIPAKNCFLNTYETPEAEIPAVAATCGDGVDGDTPGSPCAVNAEGTGCEVETGTCVFVAEVPAVAFKPAVRAGIHCTAPGPACQYKPGWLPKECHGTGDADIVARAATCGTGNDIAGNPCKVKDDGTWCEVANGECTFVPAVVGRAAIPCTLHAGRAATEVTCGVNQTDAYGAPCAVNVNGTGCVISNGGCFLQPAVTAIEEGNSCVSKAPTCKFLPDRPPPEVYVPYCQRPWAYKDFTVLPADADAPAIKTPGLKNQTITKIRYSLL